LLLYLLNLFLI